MNAGATDTTLLQALAELTALGLRLARAVTEIAEWEPRIAAAAADGRAVDAADAALAQAAPRLATLTLCFDHAARAVRRSVALARRLEQGRPLPQATHDDRRAMLLRHAARGATAAIRRRTQGDAEAAERLFADLAARLDDPALEHGPPERPVEQVVRLLCRSIGLPIEDENAPPGESAPFGPPARPVPARSRVRPVPD